MESAIVQRRKIVGVMGSGTHAHAELAEAAGRAIARGGYHLLTGGGDGVMAAAARAFTTTRDRKGLSIGVIRADGKQHLGEERAERTYRARGPNEYVELAVLTHLPHSGREGKSELSRNHINVLTAHAVVVLPGEAGTRSELELAIEYDRPVVILIGSERIDGLDVEALRSRHGSRLRIAESESELEAVLRELAGDPLG